MPGLPGGALGEMGEGGLGVNACACNFGTHTYVLDTLIYRRIACMVGAWARPCVGSETRVSMFSCWAQQFIRQAKGVSVSDVRVYLATRM